MLNLEAICRQNMLEVKLLHTGQLIFFSGFLVKWRHFCLVSEQKQACTNTCTHSSSILMTHSLPHSKSSAGEPSKSQLLTTALTHTHTHTRKHPASVNPCTYILTHMRRPTYAHKHSVTLRVPRGSPVHFLPPNCYICTTVKANMLVYLRRSVGQCKVL